MIRTQYQSRKKKSQSSGTLSAGFSGGRASALQLRQLTLEKRNYQMLEKLQLQLLRVS